MGLVITAAAYYSAGVSGANVTVSGSSGAAVVVYGAKLDDGQFAAVGSRTGDGIATCPLAPGVWVLWATAGVNGTVPVRCQVTGNPESVATRCQRAVVTTILALKLPKIQGVYNQIFPDRSAGPFVPAVFVSVAGEAEQVGNWTVLKDQIAYPIRVTFLDEKGTTDQQRLPLYQFWREKIHRAFQLQGLSGVPESVLCRVTPMKIASEEPQKDPGYRQYSTAILIRAECVEPRGIGA